MPARSTSRIADASPAPAVVMARVSSMIAVLFAGFMVACPAHAQENGAREHWAYRAPSRPELPAAAGERDADAHPIDRFVRARLGVPEIGLAPEADRAILLRRLSLDLTGLPPSVEEVLAFERDASPDSYERAVERLLASPHFGERWAQVWLDLARYADTKGYEKDGRRTIWRYRDWVIDAFNADMPFDRFTIEQLAGDLLEHPTVEQLIATAFHRNTMTNDEGGTDDEEFRVAAVVDRVNTTMQVWMGTTFGCAQCHDHKYDPFTQREYYELLAFFDNTADADTLDDAPTIASPTPGQRAKAAALEAELGELRAVIERGPAGGVAAERVYWEGIEQKLERWQRMAPETSAWRTTGPFAAASFDLAFATGFEPERGGESGGTGASGAGWVERPEWRDAAVHNGLRGDNSAHYLRRTIRVAVAGEATLSLGSDDGIKVWLNGEEVLAHKVSRGAAPDQERVTVGLGAGENRLLMKIVNGGGPSGFYFAIGPPEVAPELAAILSRPAAERSAAECEQLGAAYRAAAPELRPVREAIARLEQQLRSMNIPTTPILRELPPAERRQTHVLMRGSFLQKGAPVEPGVPRALHPLPDGAPRDRLGLARWLCDPQNPLTARVLVNRIWQHLFGVGLVETSEDFGTQGEPPSHPELLDWLACEFVGRGFRVKELLRLIVTSATYRQCSDHRPELQDVDPYNRLLGHGPRFRLEAETVRDQALAIGGLLSPKLHGPSVMPPQPDGVWQMVYSDDRWRTSPGEDARRRALYTFWRRTSPYPSMVSFDAPSREYCVVRRVRTNTPLQALVTLNDPVFVAAAGALARRVVREAGPDARSRAEHAFRLCVARRPDPAEIARLCALFDGELAHYRNAPDARAELSAAGELGPASARTEPAELCAWTVVANVLLNLDEVLTKR